MPLVFAYGSNTSTRQMRRRCPSARFAGVRRLTGYHLGFVGRSAGWGGAVATILPRKRGVVWGVVWRVSERDLRALDRYEGEGYAYLRIGAIEREDRRVLELYIHSDTTVGLPSPAYLDTILEGFKEHGIKTRSVYRALERAVRERAKQDELEEEEVLRAWEKTA
jgi:gamma-glutamylcyclotransferase (GGCT)/AIG2-like uncharacterized protein YtfP